MGCCAHERSLFELSFSYTLQTSQCNTLKVGYVNLESVGLRSPGIQVKECGVGIHALITLHSV